MSDPSKWAEKLVELVRDKEAKKTAEAEAMVVRDGIIGRGARPAWDVVRSCLKERCEAINTASGQKMVEFDVVNNATVSIRETSTGRTLKGEYDPSAPGFTIGGHVFKLDVSDKASAIQILQVDKGRRLVTPEDVAESALHEFLTN